MCRNHMLGRPDFQHRPFLEEIARIILQESDPTGIVRLEHIAQGNGRHSSLDGSPLGDEPRSNGIDESS